jgi:anti-anti-sigma factor
MQAHVRKKRRITIVDVTGRLVLNEEEQTLRTILDGLLSEGQRRFILNLNGLSVIDSAGVGEIVACYTDAQEQAALLKIVLRPDGIVRQVFKHTGLEKALEIFDEEEAAIASYR